MNVSSLIKSGVVAAAVALAVPAFSATTINLSPTGTGSTGGFTSTHTNGTTFTDDYVFYVGSMSGMVGASAIELYIDGNYLDLTSLTLNGSSVGFSKSFTNNGTYYTAVATTSSILDPQTLSIAGSVVNGGGTYSGTVTFTTAAVPEAATWGMMLVGFGAMGGALRSNRRRAGAFVA